MVSRVPILSPALAAAVNLPQEVAERALDVRRDAARDSRRRSFALAPEPASGNVMTAGR